MKILVTGGAGFIGSHVVDAYVQAGHDVSIVDDLSTGKTENVNGRAEMHCVDIRDYGHLERVFAKGKFEVVCHQAARANVQESFEKPVYYAEINIIGSLHLLALSRAYGIRKFIYASSGGAVYGEPQYLPVDEVHPIHPLDPYGASKHHVEHYLELYHANGELDYTILRYSNVYGLRQNPQAETGVISIFVEQMLMGKPQVINGDGEQTRDFLYVGDVAQANLMALQQGNNATLNLGTGRGTTINTLHCQLARITHSTGQVTHAAAKKGEVARIWLDCSRAKKELGWSPKVELEEGLELTVQQTRAKLAATIKHA